MSEEATVDCYNESEQVAGLFTMIDANLQVGQRQRVPIIDLPMPDPPPKGAEWIEAYRRWIR